MRYSDILNSKGLFGPLFHGTTPSKMEKILKKGFVIPYGKSARNGFSSYWNENLPLQTLGYGVYFTLSRDTAAAYSRRRGLKSNDLPEFFIDTRKILKVHLHNQNDLITWAKDNGYNFVPPPEASTEREFRIPSNGPIGSKMQSTLQKVISIDWHHPSVMEERVRATKEMTNHISKSYDAVWLHGLNGAEPFDGEQVCVYDPSIIFRG